MTLNFSLTFLMGLRKEWRTIILMINTQENLCGYSLSNIYNILKAHENEVKDIVEKNKSNFGGPLALVSKVSSKEVGFDDDVGDVEEGFLLNLDDEVVAYYSNNKVKKIFKKPFSGKFKNSSESKAMLMFCTNMKEVTKVENKEVENSSEKKKEIKSKGDSGYRCKMTLKSI